jgi:hypothetical protein
MKTGCSLNRHEYYLTHGERQKAIVTRGTPG